MEKVRLDIRSVKDLGKVQMIGAQNEVIYLNFSTRKLAALGLDQRQVVQSLQAQNAVTPSGVVEAGPERISVRTSGNFRSEKDLQAVNLRVNDRFYRLSTWPASAAISSTRRPRCSATRASRPSAWRWR